jgi:cobalt-precorrin-5B (C1)-methyltransferase
VPKGEHLARKTLNAKLGIIGGISILGTTGLVKPLSHRAYIATIRSCLSVAAALGIRQVILTTGRRSERFAQHTVKGKPEEAFIQIGDYFQKSLVLADEFDMQEITLAVFFGKACKMALGVPHTHAAKSKLTLTRLADWTQRATQDATLSSHIARANTAREAFNLLKASHPEVIYEVGRRITRSALRFLPRPIPVHSIIFDFDGQVFFDSQRNERQAQ